MLLSEKISESESVVMTEATEITTAPIENDIWYVEERVSDTKAPSYGLVNQ